MNTLIGRTQRLTLQISEPQLVDANSIRKEPVLNTPSDYFALKYPRLTKNFGAAFLEANWIDNDGILHIDPVEVNTDLFAAILGGDDQQIRTVYYEPEHQWYSFDPVLGYFSPNSEEKLKLEISQELVHCAGFLSAKRHAVNIGPIFKTFRSDEVLESIVKRGEGMLGVKEAFFDEKTGNRKAPQSLELPQTAKIFVLESLEHKEKHILTVAEAYSKYVDFCQVKKMPVLTRKEFRQPAVESVRSTFGVGLRKDLRLNNKWAHGWTGLDTKLIAA
jgi:hypothetical protein